eukprot:12492844-Heterocapsa_arctica.AAC.1
MPTGSQFPTAEDLRNALGSVSCRGPSELLERSSRARINTQQATPSCHLATLIRVIVVLAL